MVLQLHNTNLAIFNEQLRAKVAQAPGMFKNTPLILDLNSLSDEQAPPDWHLLCDLCQQQGLTPLAISGGSAYWQSQIKTINLPQLNNISHTQKKIILPKITAKIVHQPVRSGQQIITEGDLIILSMVSVGAEILAGGNIHVYGALRGKALAGINGNTQARIFTQKLEADLVSIAGQYQLRTEKDERWLGKPAQVYLQENILKIQTFGI